MEIVMIIEVILLLLVIKVGVLGYLIIMNQHKPALLTITIKLE
jgi:hypothetical protein